MKQAINEQVQRANLAARFERMSSNEMVQTQRAVRYPDTGTGIYTVFVAEDAPASDHIRCFKDYDGADAAAWSHKAWEGGDTVLGDDDYIYRCTTAYTATDDTTKPGVAGQEAVWGVNWKVIDEVVVYCNISGWGNLEDALPHLLTGTKSLGFDAAKPAKWVLGTVYSAGAKVIGSNPHQFWKCSTGHTATADDRPSTGTNYATYWTLATWGPIAYSVGDIVPGTNSKEFYSCILAHTGTADNRPSSGDDWETYWEVTKRFADELLVIEKDDCIDIGIWSHRAFLAGEMITGDDDGIYRCWADFTASDDTTKPITGANYASHWTLISGIYQSLYLFEASFINGPYYPGAEAAGRKVITITTTAEANALTNAQLLSCPIINCVASSTAIVLTLLAASASNLGADVLITRGGAAAVSVVCAAGFGGGGSGVDTVVLAQGDMCHCFSVANKWFTTSATPPG